MGLMNRVLRKPEYQRERHEQEMAPTAAPDTREPLETPLSTAREFDPVPRESARRLDYVLNSLETIPAGIGFPGAVFDLLVHTLSVTSGAMLIRDVEDKRFKVWASCGIDPTTRGRLILKRKVIDELVPERVSYLDETRREQMGQYLSVRERSLHEPVLLCRFQTSSRLCGVLVIFRSPELFADSENAELLLAALSEPVARVISTYRETPLQRMINPLILNPKDFRRSVQTSMRRLLSSSHGLVLAYINLNRITESVLSVLPTADRYHVTRDIRLIAASMFAAAGDVTIVEPDGLVVAVTMPSGEHGELLIDQLSGRLGALLPELPGRFRVEARIRQWPIDSDNADSLLDDLLNQT